MQHTLKSQIVIDQNHRIICANTTHEKEHNFSLFKNSILNKTQKEDFNV